MKRYLPFIFLLSIFFSAAAMSAGAAQPRYNTIVVKHFTNANGMAQSQEFIQYFAEDLCTDLVKYKVSIQAVAAGAVVPDADAANSVVVEGKFLSRESGGIITPGKLNLELSLYRLSDHALVKTWDAPAYFMHNGDRTDKEYAYETAHATAQLLWQALRGIDLSAIPPAAPGAAASAPVVAPASGVSPAGPDALASVQLTSDPTGAEITIDGNYVGSTPSTVNLKAGTHAIKMKLPGYTPWVRSVETEGGETRNFAAQMEKASQ